MSTIAAIGVVLLLGDKAYHYVARCLYRDLNGNLTWSRD